MTLSVFEDPHPTLTWLTRLAQRREEASGWILDAFDRDFERLAMTALDVAMESGEPIGRLLARKIESDGVPEVAAKLALRLAEPPYNASVPLWETALAAADQALAALLAMPLERRQRDALARLYNNRAVRLDALGRWEDALEASREAAAFFRELAEDSPDEYLPACAMSLDNLGTQLHSLGRAEEGLAAVQEAFGLRKRLTDQDPEHLPELATSLGNLSVVQRVSAGGRRRWGPRSSPSPSRSPSAGARRMSGEPGLDSALGRAARGGLRHDAGGDRALPGTDGVAARGVSSRARHLPRQLGAFLERTRPARGGTQAEASGGKPDPELIGPIARKQIEMALASGEVEMPEDKSDGSSRPSVVSCRADQQIRDSRAAGSRPGTGG